MLSLLGRHRAAPHRILLPKLLLGVSLAFLALGCARAATPEGDPAPPPPPPLGWSSSGHFGCDVSEQLVREMADAMVSSGLRTAGYRYIVVDGCWHAGRDAAGNLVVDPERFASGMKTLAAYAHARGLKFGLQADAGALNCQRRADGSGHDERDQRQFAAWGVDELDHDWCANVGWKYPDLPALGRDSGNADDYRADIGLWAVLAAPLIVGADLRNMAAVTRGILVNRQVIAVSQDELGAPGRRLRRDGDLDIWLRLLTDGAYALLLLNRGDSELAATVNWTELGLPPRGSLLLRDLWNGRNLGRQRGGYSAMLAPHASLLVRATP